jgi:hypothetical protein
MPTPPMDRSMPMTVAVPAAASEDCMEFHIAMGTSPMDIVVIDEAIRDLDPAAVVDLDGNTLRVATSLEVRALTSAIRSTGIALDERQVTQLPSICCGACSG